MSQREYNRERKAQSDLIKRDFQRDKALAELYQEGLTSIQDKIDKFYLRYAGREGLTKQEAMKRASEFDVTKFADFAKEAVRDKDFTPYTNQVLRLYNMKMQVSRLQLMQAELEMDLQNLLTDTNDLMDKARIEELTREFKRQAGILGNSATSPSDRYKAILDADFYGAKFSERVWGREGLHGNLKQALFGSLGRVYTDMMGYKQERDRLAKQFGTSRANAQRLLRTEISRITTKTAYQKLVDNDFTHLIYVAEAGACPICAGLDNKAIPIDDGVMGDTLPPMHPNCRCHFYGHIKLDRKDGTSTLDEYDLWEKPLDKSTKDVEKTSEKGYNQGMNSSGAVYGAWNDQNDPDEIHRRAHAELYYNSVRNRNTDNEVKRIAKNTGFSENDVRLVYHHVFENQYELEGGLKTFDPDYDMAQSWDRLFTGKDIQKHDMTLLHHELMESRLMSEGMDYDTAHKITQKTYDYLSDLIKWQIERGDL